MKSSIRNVIFDFGGVILRWRPKEIVERFYAEEPLRRAASTVLFGHPDWHEMDRGTLDERSAAQRFAIRMQRPVEEMFAFLQHVKDSLTPIPESLDLLHQLTRAGVPLYGLSNMPAEIFDHLRARDTHWSLFRGIVISAEVKMIKPEPQIFEHISQTYGLTPTETVFIDDLPANVEAAKRLGFKTILFEDTGRCAAELGSLLDF